MIAPKLEEFSTSYGEKILIVKVNYAQALSKKIMIIAHNFFLSVYEALIVHFAVH
jgi:hypothetical protein